MNAEDVVTRVGVLGIENSHAEELIQHLNVERLDGRLRVTALVGGDPERAERLARVGGIDTVVETATELHGRVDALFLATRDGAAHRHEAVPFLEAGVPVWIDKPFATTVSDVDAMIEAAERGGTVLTSSSALRWIPDADDVAAEMAAVGAVETVTVTGPVDEADPHGGIFFYGIHLSDLAQRFVPGLASDIEVCRRADAVVIRHRVGEVRVDLELVHPTAGVKVPFRVRVDGRGGRVERTLALTDSYFAPGAEAFALMLRSGDLAVPFDEMREAVRVLEHAARLL